MAAELISDFEVSTDPARISLDRVEQFLRRSYWASTRSRELIERSVRRSLCVGAYRKADGLQVGFARAVTDFASYGWINDVFVEEDCRGIGLGRTMVQALIDLPDLKGLRLILYTADAQGLYEKLGFRVFENPERWMEMFT